MQSLILTSVLLTNLWTVQVPKWDTDEVLMQLAYCESSNNPNAYVKDDGGSPSIGLFQFKQATWDWAVKRYFGGDKVLVLPGEDILLAVERYHYIKSHPDYLDIWNPEHQRIIARKMIEEGRGAKNWKNCFKKLGL